LAFADQVSQMRTSGLSAEADNRHEVPGEDDFNRRE